MKSAFSIDVEDGISLAMRDFFNHPIPQTDQVERCTLKILDLLESKNVKSTFFVLGQVADKFPDLIKKIDNEGHEIGIHGYNHLRIDRISQKKAKEELFIAKNKVQELIGSEVIGHRAPAFSVGPNEEWVFDILIELGFKYDSSVMPTRTSNYGWPGFNFDITKIKTNSGGEIWEVPMSVSKYFNRYIPFSGGSYLRLLPEFILKKTFQKEGETRPVILYIHPYELDTIKYPDYYFRELQKLSVLKQIKIKSNWINRKKMAVKLEGLLDNFEFTTMQSVLDDAIKNEKYSKINL